jgi:hypothetical protein
MFKGTTFLGLGADIWWQGFAGAIFGGLIAVVVSWITARGQVRGVRQQVEQEARARKRASYEKAASELLEQLPALADRTRTYATTRRADAISGRKYDNLYNDARREVTKRLTLLGDRPLKLTIAETPIAFERYARCFANGLLLPADEAERSAVRCAEVVQGYISDVVDLIYEDWATEEGSSRRIPVPPMP